VLAAARELNYAGPDPMARSLRRGRSGIVGVVLEDRVRDAFRDPIVIATLDGVTEEIGAIDAAVLLLADAADHHPGSAGASLTDAPIDAAVLLGCSARVDDALEALRSRGIPLVAIECPPTEDTVHIDQDNREGTRVAAEHLRELGHTRVTVVALPLDRPHTRGPITDELLANSSVIVTRDRLAGARDVFPDAPAVATGGSLVEEGMVAGLAVLDVPLEERPTAIIAQSDLLAAGVIRAAEQLGIAVPEQLSVVGFDGVKVDGLWPYDLTTLVQPAVDKGRAAGRAVVRMLSGEPVESVAFSSEFHLGNTTAPPAR
jgi:DNA-binding LacI/PurR family transcriptional regulator